MNIRMSCPEAAYFLQLSITIIVMEMIDVKNQPGYT